jgi:outer membrane protein TolC
MFSYLATLMLMGALPPCGPLDVETARALAAERSDEVAIREAELASAHVDEALARSLRILPSATATLITGPSPEARGNVVESGESNRSLKGLRPFGRIDVNVVQPIYTWGRLDAASDAAAAGVKARQELVVDTTSQVQLRVTQLYWGASLARRLLVIAADVEKALAEADRHIAKSLESGDGEVSPADKYRLDLFRGILRGKEAEAQKGLELARIGMAATLGMPPARLSLKEDVLDPPEGDLPDAASVLANAERQRPDLHAIDQAIRARDAEVRAEQGAMKPQFFVAGVFSYGYAPNRDIQLNPWVRDDFNVFNLGAVLGLRQDLSFATLSARAKKALAEKDVLEKQRAGLMRLVQVQVDGAIAEVKAARARLAAAKSSLGSGRSLFRSVGLDFAAGVIEAKSLIEAYALFVESQVGAAQAAYDLVVARGRLALVAGEPPRKGVQCELQ